MTKAIFLDRDGTLIEDIPYLNDPSKVRLLPQAVEGLKLLKEKGFLFFIATNQSGVPRNLVQPQKLQEIHETIQEKLKPHGLSIEKFFHSPFMPETHHPLRKPRPGMLFQAAYEFQVDLSNSWMIGDKDSDVEAGIRAGANSILIGTNSIKRNSTNLYRPHYVVSNLLEAAHRIIYH